MDNKEKYNKFISANSYKSWFFRFVIIVLLGFIIMSGSIFLTHIADNSSEIAVSAEKGMASDGTEDMDMNVQIFLDQVFIPHLIKDGGPIFPGMVKKPTIVNTSLIGDPSLTDGDKVPANVIVRKLSNAHKKVAITFDDGPYPIYTSQYLAVLDEYDTPATFFVMGSKVEKYPDLVRKIKYYNQEIGTHSYKHDNLKGRSAEYLRADFNKTKNALASVSVVPKVFRPPYGEHDVRLLYVSNESDQIPIYWSIDTKDWKGIQSKDIITHVKSNIHDGAIILLHEGKDNTLAALPGLIREIRAMGYEFVTVSDLIQSGMQE